MPKFRLKITLWMLQGLVAIKRAALFLLRLFFVRSLESIGKFFAHIFIFPLYKLYLKTRLKDYNLFKLFFNPHTFFVLFVFSGLFLAVSQTKTYGTSKYINGNQSLLFQYFSAGPDADYIEEEGADVVVSDSPLISEQFGLTAPTSINGTFSNPTYDLVSFNNSPSSVSTPLVLPGVTFGGVNREVIKYVVQQGDTLAVVADKFGINIDTLAVENKITTRTILHPGDVLNVLPVTGISYKVKKGDTLKKIAALYKVSVEKISEFNILNSDADLKVGETIIIPEAKALPVVIPRAPVTKVTTTVKPQAIRTSAEGMLWPTSGHYITQYFSWRHTGIDVGIGTGNPLYASDDGVVEKSGWNTGGYGYMVLINHGNGIKTRYGHASKLLVSAGEEVRKGDVIALSGNTGRSTGPHLHFEVIVNGARVNPFLYVR